MPASRKPVDFFAGCPQGQLGPVYGPFPSAEEASAWIFGYHCVEAPYNQQVCAAGINAWGHQVMTRRTMHPDVTVLPPS